jgi:TatD DNase family protein
VLPPLDSHAHVETGIPANDLRELRAVVVAVTREPAEWEAALARNDPMTLWGIGAHPGKAGALRDFDAENFRAATDRAAFVGEVGLDARARTDKSRQAEVFGAVLDVLAEQPRPVTIHSTAASGDVVAALRRRPVAGAILHWWRGTREETDEAIELGCFFSINGHEIRAPKILDWLPPDRLLTETDFPHSQRYDRAASLPGNVGTVEAELERRWNTDRSEVRGRLWRNFGSILTATRTVERMPRAILAALVTSGFEG